MNEVHLKVPFRGFRGRGLNHFVGAIRARKRIRLRLKHKAHPQDISHRFPQGFIGFEVGIGIDIGMDFEADVIFIQEIAEFVGDVDGLPHFSDHPLTEAEGFVGFFIVDKHEPALLFPEENDDSGKLGGSAPHLGIGTNADLQTVTIFDLPFDGVADSIQDIPFNSFAIESPPGHMGDF